MGQFRGKNVAVAIAAAVVAGLGAVALSGPGRSGHGGRGQLHRDPARRGEACPSAAVTWPPTRASS